MQNVINAVTYVVIVIFFVILSLFKVDREMQLQIKTFHSLNSSIVVAS